MSLKGSLETFALPEVLHLLADTSKSGELLVHRDGADGRIWFDSGSVSAFDVADSEEPFEAIFELMRDPGGDFEFFQAQIPSDHAKLAPAEHRDVRVETERAEARLAEWVDIVAVVPSLAHDVRLARVAPGDKITVDRSQWEMLVAVGGGSTVGTVLSSCSLREFEGCKAVKGLVDASLVEISDESLSATPEADVPVVEELPVAEDAPVAEDEPVAEDVPLAEDEQVNAHYSQLWAAAMEATLEESVEPAPGEPPLEVEATVAFEQPEEYEYTGRDALNALVAEVAASETEEVGEAGEQVDGLKDRGPWTSHELASFDEWRDESFGVVQPVSADSSEGEHFGVVPIRPLSAYDATLQQSEDHSEEQDHDQHGDEVVSEGDSEGDPDAPAEDEPINRGLLLKFLSSVRN